jgi:hypothetical protein
MIAGNTFDFSKEGNHVTPTDISYSNGPLGMTATFNGTTSQFTRANAISESVGFAGAYSYTISWIMNMTQGGTTRYIFNRSAYGVGGYTVRILEDGRPQFLQSNDEASPDPHVSSGCPTISAYYGREVLMFLVFTRVDGVANQARFFVWDVDVTNSFGDHPDTGSVGTDMLVGADFDGQLPFVGIWAGAWSQDMITEWSHKWRQILGG